MDRFGLIFGDFCVLFGVFFVVEDVILKKLQMGCVSFRFHF